MRRRRRKLTYSSVVKYRLSESVQSGVGPGLVQVPLTATQIVTMFSVTPKCCAAAKTWSRVKSKLNKNTSIHLQPSSAAGGCPRAELWSLTFRKMPPVASHVPGTVVVNVAVVVFIVVAVKGPTKNPASTTAREVSL